MVTWIEWKAWGTVLVAPMGIITQPALPGPQQHPASPQPPQQRPLLGAGGVGVLHAKLFSPLWFSRVTQYLPLKIPTFLWYLRLTQQRLNCFLRLEGRDLSTHRLLTFSSTAVVCFPQKICNIL